MDHDLQVREPFSGRILQVLNRFRSSNLDRATPRSLSSLRTDLAKQEKGRQRDREDAEKAKRIYKGEEEVRAG